MFIKRKKKWGGGGKRTEIVDGRSALNDSGRDNGNVLNIEFWKKKKKNRIQCERRKKRRAVV